MRKFIRSIGGFDQLWFVNNEGFFHPVTKIWKVHPPMLESVISWCKSDINGRWREISFNNYIRKL